MTLITYPVRAHFADGVLEEALRSELETHQCVAPLVIADESQAESEFTERVYSGFPRRCRPWHYSISATTGKRTASAEIREAATQAASDVIIAYGSVRAIAFARKARNELTPERAKVPRIDLFAVPGIDGLPGPCKERGNPCTVPSDPLVRTGLPSIVICDPTLTLAADGNTSARAAMTVFIHCIEAYLSAAFNPPADGMALDGMHRASQIMIELNSDTLGMRRNLMAAAFNAMLCQQKGVGPAQVIGDALKARLGGDFAGDIAAGLLLPGVLGSYGRDNDKRTVVGRLLGLEVKTDLPEGVSDMLSLLKMPQSLSELGASKDDMRSVANDLAERLPLPRRPGSGTVKEIMEAVF